MAHLHTAYRCNYCREIPETTPVYYCASRHLYCVDCFRKLQRNYRGSVDGAGFCVICKSVGIFGKSEVNPDFLKRLRNTPGIGRPFRYNIKKIPQFKDSYKNINDKNSHVETSQGDGFTCTSLKTLKAVSSTAVSKRPLTCLHDGCKKSVAVSSLITHFKHDHGSVPCFGVGKGNELKLLFDVSLVEHNRTLCLAMITVYESNKIDIVRSKSSQSVVNTCRMLSGKMPLNTFWLMMSGSNNYRKSTSYVIYWLYSNREEKYWCTLELSSTNDSISVSSFCSSVGLHQGRTVEEVARSMNCLLVCHGSFISLLGEGDKINLRITVH